MENSIKFSEDIGIVRYRFMKILTQSLHALHFKSISNLVLTAQNHVSSDNF